MRMYTEGTTKVDKVAEEIYTLLGYELRECKKVELELEANVGKDQNILIDIWKDIWDYLGSVAIINSTCEIWFANKEIAQCMCKYRIKIYNKEN